MVNTVGFVGATLLASAAAWNTDGTSESPTGVNALLILHSS
jgi:hypothetical protein